MPSERPVLQDCRMQQPGDMSMPAWSYRHVA